MKPGESRCCTCPQKNLYTEICCKDEEVQCNFVLLWSDPRGQKYKVMREIGGDYRVFFQGNTDGSGWSGWKCMQQFEGKEHFDEAQVELNHLANKQNWKPSIYSNEEIETLKFFKTDNKCHRYWGSPGGGRAYHPVIEKEEKEELQKTEKDSFDNHT